MANSHLRLLLNPLDLAPRRHLGVPILPGSYPGIGHLLAVRHALPDLLLRAEASVGPLFFLEMRGPRGKTLDLVPLRSESAPLLRSSALSSSVLRANAEALLGESMIVADGAEHQRQRSPWSTPFTPRGLTSAEVGRAVADTVTSHVRRWVRSGEMRLLDATQGLTLEIIFRLLDDPPDDLVEWRTQYRQLLLVVARLPFDFPGSPASRGRAARAWLEARLRSVVARASAAAPESSFLTRLVHGVDEADRSANSPHLVDNLKLLLLAGHETSATAMSWLLIELARKPELFDRLVAEATAVGHAHPR